MKGGLRRDRTLDEAGRIRGYTYSRTGASIGVTVPANLDQAYSYDDLDRLTSFIASGTSQTYQYDANGNRIQTGIGGSVYSHAIDPLSNRLLASSGPAPAKQNSYDAAGNLLSDGSTTFTYSDRGRLQSASRASITTSYLYNGLGQRVVKHSGAASGTPPPGLPPAPPPLPANCSHASQLQRHAEIAQYRIDLANEHARIMAAVAAAVGKVAKAKVRLDGQQNIERIQAQIATVKQGVQSCHDALVLHMAYRAAVKAARQAAGGNTGGSATDAVTYYVYDEAGHLLGEYDAAGKVIQQTVYLGDVPVAVLKPVATANANGSTATSGTGVYYIHTDQLDAPRVITRASDNVMVWRWDQADPYGVMQPEENLGGLGSFKYNLRLPGQLYDQETGLHYNYFRDDDPATGRYVQSDPVGLAGGQNTYAYARGNPVKHKDPLGLDVFLCQQPAFGISWNPVDHYWIKTDTVEAGMGGTRGLEPGNQAGDRLGDPVQITDHSGRSKQPLASCKKIDNADENTVSDQLKIGRPLGNWGPTNQCQTFARGVINQNTPALESFNIPSVWGF